MGPAIAAGHPSPDRRNTRQAQKYQTGNNLPALRLLWKGLVKRALRAKKVGERKPPGMRIDRYAWIGDRRPRSGPQRWFGSARGTVGARRCEIHAEIYRWQERPGQPNASAHRARP
jgi:hypothetical protein